MIVSEFAPVSKTGFDVNVTAQPKRIVQNKNEVLLEKAGYDSNIEGSQLFPDKLKHVVALPIMTLSVRPDSDIIVINFQLSDGSKIESQKITIPLKSEGYAMSIGRFASDYSKLRAEGKWCGSCDTCAKKCTDCADNQTGDFNCATCTIGCH